MTDEQQTKQLKCERCESPEPASTYDPRTPGHPHKRVNLCDVCAGKDDKAVLVGEPTPEVPPLEGDRLDNAIAEVKAEDENEIETIEFTPQPPKPIEENIVTPRSKRPKATENLAKDVETKPELPPNPIDRETIEKQLKEDEEAHDKLIESRERLLSQLTTVNQQILARRGAIARMRELLGKQ